MATPWLNPLTAKLLGGAPARQQIRAQLLSAAEATDDPAYAARLRAVADGRRPLRTLMSDPGFLAERGLRTPAEQDAAVEQIDALEPPKGTPEQNLAEWQAEAQRRGIPIPSVEELQAVLPEVSAMLDATRAVVAEERGTGWGGTEQRLDRTDRDAPPGR